MDQRLNTNGINDIQKRHLQRQLNRKRAMKRRRIIFYTVLIIIVLSVLLFFTPIFNIKKIDITGNVRIETPQIKQAIGSVEEDNLFLLNTKKIAANIETLPYVNSVKIEKKIFPVGLNVEIVECEPIGYISYGEKFVILDKNLKVLEISDSAFENLFVITGVSVTSAEEGAVIASDDQEKLNEIIQCVITVSEQEIAQSIGSMDFTDMSNITFNYENRLDVICGSSLDFPKKISMFKKALSSPKLTDNSRGTIDLSVSGKAIYTP